MVLFPALGTAQTRQVLAAVYNCPLQEMHLYAVRRDTAALGKLMKHELDTKNQLSRADVDKLVPNMRWIYELGIHLGLLSEKGREKVTIVFAVKIRCVFFSRPHILVIMLPVHGSRCKKAHAMRSSAPCR